MAPSSAPPSAPLASSPWHVFGYRAFAVIWTATVVSDTGTWMYNAASGWLMTRLNPAALIVSLVQVANTLPLFLLALPAGALADMRDKRRFLITLEIWGTLGSAVLAACVSFGWINAAALLLFTFLIGVGAALSTPAWQAIVSDLVPREQLHAAITANSTGFNVSRALGPALGGACIAAWGMGAPFWLNALSNLAVVAALIWWRPPRRAAATLPAERFGNAMVLALRHARYNRTLRAALARAVAFFLFAGAYWALLPLIARTQLAGGPALYGVLLGAIGAGAVAAALALPRLQQRLSPGRLVALGSLGTVCSLALYGIARAAPMAVLASLLAGASWIAVLSSLNTSAQLALPEWVRGRGLAVYMAVVYGTLTISSSAWGIVAEHLGVPATLLAAGLVGLISIPLTRRWRLRATATIDQSPSMHWPTPLTLHDIDAERGPVLVTVEYRIAPHDRAAFVLLLERLGRARRRSGAYAWSMFEDTAQEGRILETFLIDSWVEHLRQHQRMTSADRHLQESVQRFNQGGTPRVTHLVALEPHASA